MNRQARLILTSQDIMDLFVKLKRNDHDYGHARRDVADKADRIIHILDGRVQEEEVLTHE